MGAYLSEPVTTKHSEDGEGNNLRFGACSMQGWRVSQEDAHNCLPNFDKDGSFFAVYDGHGGAEVAIYLSRHFPEVLKNCEAFQNGNWEEALRESYLKVDASIPTKSVLLELQKIAKQQSGDKKGESVTDYEEENVNALYEEATMPLEKLVALYQHKTGAAGDITTSSNEMEIDKPCSSKAVQSPSKSIIDKPESSPSVNSNNVKENLSSLDNSSTPSTATNNSVHDDSPSSTTVSSNNIPTKANEEHVSPINTSNEDTLTSKEENTSADVNLSREEKKAVSTLENGSSSNYKENDEIVVKNDEKAEKKDEIITNKEEKVEKKDEIIMNNDEVIVKKDEIVVKNDVIKSVEEPTHNGDCDTVDGNTVKMK